MHDWCMCNYRRKSGRLTENVDWNQWNDNNKRWENLVLRKRCLHFVSENFFLLGINLLHTAKIKNVRRSLWIDHKTTRQGQGQKSLRCGELENNKLYFSIILWWKRHFKIVFLKKYWWVITTRSRLVKSCPENLYFGKLSRYINRVCDVRRIVSCLCMPIFLARRFSLIVLIVLTRPRAIDGPRFLCNSAYLGDCVFFSESLERLTVCQRTNRGPRGGPLLWKTYRSLQHKVDIA